MKLAIKILHYRPHRQDQPDRTNWINVMKFMLNDSRVSVFTDDSGYPYDGLNNLYHELEQENPDQVLILHHDILPCFNFIPTVEKILKLVGNQPVTFYTNSKSTDQAMVQNTHWLKIKIWYYSQAYTMPFSVMKTMIKWINHNVGRDDRMSDDERMAMYFYFHHQYVYATSPSLVEHIGWNSTMVDYSRPMEGYLDNKEHRMARKFIGIDFDPLQIDWTKGLNSPILSNDDWALENSDILFQKLLKTDSKYKQT